MERNRRREAPPSREFGDGEALGPRNWVTTRGGGGGREGVIIWSGVIQLIGSGHAINSRVLYRQ